MKYSITGTDCYVMSNRKLQARAKFSIVQRLWSQLSLSYSRKLTCFQNSERMGGTEIYQATTVTITMKCILNHTSWRCKADCVRRQLVFGPEEGGMEIKQTQEMNHQILTHMIHWWEEGWGRQSKRV